MSEIGYQYWLNCRPGRITFNRIGQGSISLTPAVQQGGSRLVVQASVVRYRRAGAIPQGQGQVPTAPVVQTPMDIGRVLIEHEPERQTFGTVSGKGRMGISLTSFNKGIGPSPPESSADPVAQVPVEYRKGTTIPFKMNETK